MADQGRGRGGDRGRGGGRGRGRGDFDGGRGGGGRGGGGRGRGDDSGGRGGGGRGRGDDSGGRGGGGRGRGDDFGGRGRGGDFGGRGRGGDIPFRPRGGDFGGRGRGGDSGGRGRGGRGGFGGKPDKFAGEEIVFRPGPIPSPDPTITKLEDDLIKAPAPAPKAAGKEGWFPRRPAFGTQGTKVTLWANYFKLDSTMNGTLLKYSVKVQLNKKDQANKKVRDPKGMKLHTIIKRALEKVASSGPAATEFKDQVITLQPLKLPENSTITVPYTDEGKDDEYDVVFHGPSTIDVPNLLKYLRTMRDPSGDVSYPKFEDAIDALSIIAGFSARRNADVSALGRSRYFPLAIEGEQFDLGYPEFNRIIRGYFQSARPATGRLILNVNVAHGVFRLKGPVSELITKFQGPMDMHRALSKLRAQCKVFSDDKDPKKTRIIQKVISGLANVGDGSGPNRPKVQSLAATARNVQFFLRAPAPAGLKADAYCSVADYYLKRYGYTVNPDHPVVNVGSKLKPVYMPAELVRVIDGQALKRKTNPDETRGMINFSCRSPFANATSISTYGRTVLGLDSSDTLQKFGLQVGKALLTVQGRELPPPTIVYMDAKQVNKKNVNVIDGEWNMENVSVVKSGTEIKKWFWISIDYGARAHQRHSEVSSGMESWIRFMRSQGIPIAQNPLPCRNQRITIQRSGGTPADFIRPAYEEMKAQNPQFVFVVLPGRKTDTDIYNEVKKLGDRTYGYLSQNILQSNLLKNSPQIYANLGLKVNLKMGGINHKLQGEVTIIKDHPTMVVGYDVTHPTNLAGNTTGLPSLVGLVASIDKELGQWPATAWAQTGRVEMLDKTLEVKFRERLELYRHHNRQLPVNIIIFRDGVSEGQFAQVLEKELPYIRKACEGIYPANQKPKIAVIVSVKRHQTRFFPTDPNHMVRSRNIKNGTVVDRGVTQATTWDFFLTAHKGLQGTSRPAHYTVLLDEVFRNLSRDQAANQLEKLTYEMCHLFGRATKAVSICPPAYYADILCTRARVYLSDMFENSDTMSSVSSATSPDVIDINVHENLKNSMFYI